MSESDRLCSAARNSVPVIFPYRQNGVWMFDDDAVGLVKEPFVDGAPEIIDRLVTEMPQPHQGFALYFSDCPFPGHQAELVWLREERDGNWYRLTGTDMEGWLCPALFRYFRTPPRRIYCRLLSRAEASRTTRSAHVTGTSTSPDPSLP